MKTPRLFFLGSPKLEIDNQPVELAAKAIALLAYIAVQREPQTRDRVLGLLWTDSTEDAARKNLRNTLWSIRKALGDAVLIADDDKLALGESVWVDVREFERIADFNNQSAIDDLQSAIELYRAPFLDDFSLSNSSEFEIWLTSECERFAQLFLRSADALVKSYRTKANWTQIVRTATRALAQDNLQEPMYRALMEAYAYLGERAAALHQYDVVRATLDRELGVAPLPETEELRAAILSGTVSPASPVVPNIRSGKIAPRQTTSPPTPFIGRQAERDKLDAELQTATQGHVRIALIVGELGIGKSRLWQEWSSKLTPKLTALQVRCLESTKSLPFAPLIELFSRRSLAEQLFAPTSSVPAIWLAEITRLLPEIRAARPELPTLSALPPEEERRRVFEAFAQCLLALCPSPIVFFIDDAHWADRATLDWLDYLAHRLRDYPLLLVLAYRTEEAPASLVHLVAGWGREGLTHRIPLTRLTPEESEKLIALLGGNSEFATRAQVQSAGNPYFLIELFRAGGDDIPPVLNELVRARLDALPDTARQVLQAAAVIEPGFDFVTLRRTSGRDEEETLTALDTLLNANVLTERESHYDFAHPLVATIVRDRLSGARRAFLHRRAAEALEAANAGRLPQIAGQLTRHYAQANDSTRAAHFAETAAERALALAATDEAVNFYQQALALEPTPARQVGLANALMRQGALVDARNLLESALHDFEAEGNRRGAARAAMRMAETLYPSGRFEEARKWIEKGLGYLESEGDPESRTLAHSLLGSGPHDDAKSFADVQRHLSEATRHAIENHLLAIAARSQFVLGNVLAEHGDLPNALNAYRESIRFAHEAGDDYQEVLGHNNFAYHAMLAGDLTAAHDKIEKALALADSRALRLPLQYLYSTYGEIALAEKKWGEAESWLKRGLVEAQANGNIEQTAGYYANLGRAAHGRGDLEAALGLFEQASKIAATLAAPHRQIQIDLWLTELYRERGERVAANESLAHAEARLASGQRKGLIEWAQRLRKQMT